MCFQNVLIIYKRKLCKAIVFWHWWHHSKLACSQSVFSQPMPLFTLSSLAVGKDDQAKISRWDLPKGIFFLPHPMLPTASLCTTWSFSWKSLQSKYHFFSVLLHTWLYFDTKNLSNLKADDCTEYFWLFCWWLF